jgi:hypothetical protein
MALLERIDCAKAERNALQQEYTELKKQGVLDEVRMERCIFRVSMVLKGAAVISDALIYTLWSSYSVVATMQSHLANVPRAVLATFAQVFGIVKGCVGGICLYGALPLFYFRGLGAADYQRYRAIAYLPWGGKALVAATSDTRPIGGWYKRYYLVGGGVTLILALIGVGAATSAEDALGFLTVCSAAIVVIDTLFGKFRRQKHRWTFRCVSTHTHPSAEGVYANLIAFFNADVRLVSYVWGFTMAGTVLAALIVGPLGNSENGGNIKYAFFIASFLACQVLIPVLGYPDTALPHDRTTKLTTATNVPLLEEDEEEARTHVPTPLRSRAPSPGEWVFVIWLALASVVLMILLVSSDTSAEIAIVLVIVTLITLGGAYKLFKDRPVYLAVCVYAYVHEILCIDTQGIQDGTFPPIAGGLLYDANGIVTGGVLALRVAVQTVEGTFVRGIVLLGGLDRTAETQCVCAARHLHPREHKQSHERGCDLLRVSVHERVGVVATARFGVHGASLHNHGLATSESELHAHDGRFGRFHDKCGVGFHDFVNVLGVHFLPSACFSNVLRVHVDPEGFAVRVECECHKELHLLFHAHFVENQITVVAVVRRVVEQTAMRLEQVLDDNIALGGV